MLGSVLIVPPLGPVPVGRAVCKLVCGLVEALAWANCPCAPTTSPQPPLAAKPLFPTWIKPTVPKASPKIIIPQPRQLLPCTESNTNPLHKGALQLQLHKNWLIFACRDFPILLCSPHHLQGHVIPHASPSAGWGRGWWQEVTLQIHLQPPALEGPVSRSISLTEPWGRGRRSSRVCAGMTGDAPRGPAAGNGLRRHGSAWSIGQDAPWHLPTRVHQQRRKINDF